MSNSSHFVEAKVLCKRTPHGVAVTLVSGDKPFSFVLTQAAATQALCGLMAALDEEWDVDNVVPLEQRPTSDT